MSRNGAVPQTGPDFVASPRRKAMAQTARTAGIALLLMTALNLFNYIDRYVLPGVQPLVQKEFGVNDAQIGLLTTAFFFTYMIAAPLTESAR